MGFDEAGYYRALKAYFLFQRIVLNKKMLILQNVWQFCHNIVRFAALIQTTTLDYNERHKQNARVVYYYHNIRHEQIVYGLSRFGCGRPGLVSHGMKLMLFLLYNTNT